MVDASLPNLNRSRNGYTFTALSLLVLSCSKPDVSGPVTIMAVTSQAGHCQYQIEAVELKTLKSLNQFKGSLGQVVYSPTEITNDNLVEENLYQSLPVSFAEQDGIYFPLDLKTWIASSLYAAMETTYSLTQSIDPSFDMVTKVANHSETRLVYNAKVQADDGVSISDNASYVRISSSETNYEKLNFLISYPTLETKNLPIGLNLGIFAHEYTHMIFSYQFYDAKSELGLEFNEADGTVNTIDALDEGMSDIFAFYAIQDPNFFHCSFPGDHRDMSKTRSFETSVPRNRAASFDPHEDGAVWASIQYRIGSAIGHPVNGKSLLSLMKSLPSCLASNKVISADFKKVAACHLEQLSGTARAQARTVYNQSLGVYGNLP